MKQTLKRASFGAFRLLDRIGVHLLPKHFYSPVPDIKWLKGNIELWSGRLALNGIHWEIDEQLTWLRGRCEPYYAEVQGLEFFDMAIRKGWGRGFGPIESQILHCVIRSLAPANIVEIGSGISTAIMLNAIGANRKDGRRATRVTCIEPFPKPAFNELLLLGEVEHIRTPCQAVAPETFEVLKGGDLLFVDSSHSVKTGSDVIRIYLEIIPRLAPGVLVHVHDINFPYAYSREALLTYFSFQENALLLALLTGNHGLEVLSCLSALQYDRPKHLTALLPDLQLQESIAGLRRCYLAPGHFPSSIWLRTRSSNTTDRRPG